MFDKIRNILVLALMCLVAVSYHNTFSPPDAAQTTLAMPIFYLTVVTFFVTLKTDVLKMKYFGTLVVLYVIVIVDALLCNAIFGTNALFSELKDLTIPFVALCIGYNIKISKKYLIWLLFAYGIILLFYASASQIANNIGGFVITDDYKIPSKNAIGAMLSSFIGALLPIVISKDIKKVFKIGSIILILASAVVLVTIRARASTMTFFFTVAIFVYEIIRNSKYGYQKEARLAIVLIISSIVVIPLLGVAIEPIGNYLYNSLFQNVEGDVTTGRMSRNFAAIDYFLEKPLSGTLGTNDTLLWVHNYLLRVLSSYGIIFGLVFVIIYIYFLIKLIKRFFTRGCLSVESIGYWSVVPMILLSFVEPLFPYAPGTAVLLTYILLGHSLKETL